MTALFCFAGIPMSQQHLLYNFKELDDSASLSDYSIKDGCTLKLVLSIRGGPISTRRLPLPSVDDIQWRDIRDFVENNRFALNNMLHLSTYPGMIAFQSTLFA